MDRLLAVTGASPWPPRGGFSLRAAHLLKSLAAEWEISLIVAGDDGPVRDAVNAELARGRFRAALLWPGTEFLAFGQNSLPPSVADRIDCVTLERLRSLRRRPAMVGRVMASLVYERRLARAFAATVVAGQDDARAFGRISGSARIVVIPNGVDAQPTPRFETQRPSPTVVFSGTLNYYANVDAVIYFARHVWPLVRRSIPGARLLVVGRTPSRRVLALNDLAGIDVRAEVPDMALALQEAWVAVAPMRLGTGVKNKVLEAWAVGRPVVLTPLAANGLALDDLARSLVAKRWDTFAALVVRLLSDQDMRQSLGSAALSLVRANHSWDRSAAALSQLLREVSAPTIE